MTNVEKLSSAGAAFRLNGILACIDAGKASADEILIIQKMKTDKVMLGGRPLSVYAYAALDLLGIEKYHGDDADIKELIEGLRNQHSAGIEE